MQGRIKHHHTAVVSALCYQTVIALILTMEGEIKHMQNLLNIFQVVIQILITRTHSGMAVVCLPYV